MDDKRRHIMDALNRLRRSTGSARDIDDIMTSLEEIAPDVAEKAKKKSTEKDQLRRMLPFFQLITELAATDQLIPMGIRSERREALTNMINHSKSLVDEALLLYRNGRYARAGFLAVIAVEEVGKCAVARLQFAAGVHEDASPFSVGKRGALMDHRRKYQIAACAGAVINSRMDNLLGLANVNRFIEDCEQGTLVRERESFLYYGFDGKARVPDRECSIDRVAFLIRVAAELVAEGATQEYGEWQDLLRWADGVHGEIGER